MFLISKFELQAVINKYYIGGLIEAVKWEIKDKQLSIKFTAPTKEMLGEVTHTKFNLEDSSIGISNTSQLIKLINITNGDVMLQFLKSHKVFTKLIVSDNQFTANYTLADTLTINKSGTFNGSQDFHLEMSLDKEMIVALIKAKSALDDSTTVMLKSNISLDDEFQLELIFGGDIEYSNKVSYFIPNITQNNVPKEFMSSLSDFKIGFNSDLLKDILSVNKDADESKLYINLDGLMKLEFITENIKSTYYIVQKDV
jgi:hypothetical protein